MRFIPLSTLLVAATIAAPLTAQTRPVAATRLDSALRALATQGFSGVVRVDLDEALILEKGYGLANRAAGTPFGPSSVVQIGSNTKDFTVVALLQLYEQGKLGINDSLGKFFPDAPADKRNITLWQLVTFRAGFPQDVGTDFEPISRSELIDRAMKRPLDFAPGSREGYSNTAYSILAAVIEHTSGTSYDEYVRDHILAPLGMHDTGLVLPGFAPDRLAHGYRWGTDQGTMLSKPHAADGSYWNLRGNGGMLSTLDDMHTFYSALFQTSKLLRPETRNLRFPPDQPIALAGSDGVSFFLYERLPGRHIEFMVAANDASWRPPQVRNAIAGALGLPAGGRDMASDAPKRAVHPPSPAMLALVTDFIRTLNAGDSVAVDRFVRQHFLIEPGTAPAEQRVTRMLTLHQNFGVLTLQSADQIDPASVALSITSATSGPVEITLQTDGASPARIRAVQVIAGG
ncbi:MAG TPA: serine hydrolase domain-containing protein [Gemmatimonadaceae bacterium]